MGPAPATSPRCRPRCSPRSSPRCSPRCSPPWCPRPLLPARCPVAAPSPSMCECSGQSPRWGPVSSISPCRSYKSNSSLNILFLCLQSTVYSKLQIGQTWVGWGMGVWTNIVTEQSTLSCLVLYLRCVECWNVDREYCYLIWVLWHSVTAPCYRQDSDCDSGAYSRSSSPEPIYERLDRWVIYTRYLLLSTPASPDIYCYIYSWYCCCRSCEKLDGKVPLQSPNLVLSVIKVLVHINLPMILNIVNTPRVAMSRASKLTTCCGFIVIWPWLWLLSWKVASLCCARAAIDSIEKSNQWTL